MQTLLMGGQACVLYGAAEFSRDVDLLVLLGRGNLARVEDALRDLVAHRIAVPEFAQGHLEAGHAIHFRCKRPDVAGFRVDVMSKLRGLANFEELWTRRTTVESDGELIEVLALSDLVLAKKTQRDKDWPMLRRLVERSYLETTDPAEPQIRFWLRELRTPELLLETCARHPALARGEDRLAVIAALRADHDEVERALAEEERRERDLDRAYWAPLKAQLERLRRVRARPD